MKKRHILLLLIYLSFGFASAQSPAQKGTVFESLGYYPDHAFTSDFQQQIFEKGITQNDWDLLAVFLSRDTYVDEKILEETREKLKTFYSELQEKGIESKSQKKKVSMIVKASTEQFFKTFHPNNSFDSLVQYGFYNCVTASAWLAMAFDEFQIPYSLTESHTSIQISPSDGNPVELPTHELLCSPLTPAQVDAYVLAKKLDEEEFESTYYPSENHSLQTWAALYFAHVSLLNFGNRQRMAAISEMEKAYVLDPSARYRNWLSVIMTKQLKISRYQSMDDVRIRAKQFAMAPANDRSDALAKDFETLSRTFLLAQKNEAHFDSIYHTLQANIPDREMRTRLAGIYYSKRGSAAAKAQYFEDAVPFLVRAVAIDSKNKEAKESLARSMDVVFKLNQDEGYGDRLLERVTDTARTGEWKQRLAAVYLTEWAKVLMVQEKTDKAISLSKKAFEADPGSEAVRSVLAQYLAFSFSKETASKNVTGKMASLERAYPFLKDHAAFKPAYAYLYLLKAEERFDQSLVAEGIAELAHFENLMKKYPKLPVSHEQIGIVYFKGATLLIQKNQLDEAESFLKSGRRYAGTSMKITEGLQMIVKLRTGFKKY